MAVRDGVMGGGDTRVLGVTRVLAAVIVPFLVIAWWILYLRPHDTERLFAWPVNPSMTAMLLGAVYLGGAYFFTRAVVARTWESIALGFLPVTAFTWLMGIATVLHWDRFTSGHTAFRVWAALYFTTPLVVPAVWWVNRRRVVGSAERGGGEAVLSRRAQLIAGALGVVAVVLALALFLWPRLLVVVWPWPLTPLTARVIAACAVLGAAGIGVARDPRWSSVRLFVHVLWVMLGFILVAVVRAWGELDRGSVLTWAFVAWLVAVLASSAALYRRMERHRRDDMAPTL